MAHDFPTPDWAETSTLQQPGGGEREGPLAELVMAATRVEAMDRPEYLIISPSLGELDNMQIEGLRRRPDFPSV